MVTDRLIDPPPLCEHDGMHAERHIIECQRSDASLNVVHMNVRARWFGLTCSRPTVFADQSMSSVVCPPLRDDDRPSCGFSRDT